MSNSIFVAGNPGGFHHFSRRREYLQQDGEHTSLKVFGRFYNARWELLALEEPIVRVRTQLTLLGVHSGTTGLSK